MLAVVDGLKYAKDHEWVKVEGDVATIGITDHAQVRAAMLLPAQPQAAAVQSSRLVAGWLQSPCCSAPHMPEAALQH